MEEVSMEATVKYMLKPFTAAKSADAVAGDDGPLMPNGWGDDFLGSDTASFDELLRQVKLPAARPGRKHRLSEAEIMTILALKPVPLPTTDYLDDMAGIFPPEYINERKQQLEAEAELTKKIDEEFEVFQQQVIDSVRAKGYFEVDDDYYLNQFKAHKWALEELMTNKEEAEMVPCSPSKEDAALLDPLIDDEDDDVIDDEEKAQGVDEARAHKVAPAIGDN
jgi:hypothetical protein